MRWSWIWGILSIGCLGFPAQATERPPIGSVIADFERADLTGKSWRLSARTGRKIVVLAFLRADCPVAELYGDRLARLSKEFDQRAVEFVGISCGGQESTTDLERFARDHSLGFPIVIDPDSKLADLVGASRTPEVVVLDEQRTIRYRGRIDDQYAVGSRKSEPKRHDLVESIEAILGEKPISLAEAPAVGCPISRPSIAPAREALTYCREIAPIIQARCVECHRPGQVGPFSLMTYRQVTSWAGSIANAVEEGRMPPWHADPRYGHFANDSRMTDREKKWIAEWIEAGSPEGNPADLPPPRSFTEGWRITKPDLVVTTKQTFEVPAEGVLEYQYFEVDPGFTEDQWIKASEIRPGNRKVVHHCNVFLKDPSTRSETTETGELGSFCLDEMTPGSPPMMLPAGSAKRIPAGWHLIFVVHYTPVGTRQTDQTSIGLVFADVSQVRKEVATNVVIDTDLRIPPREPNHRVEQSRRFDEDVLLLAMFPHMHLRGKSFRYEAIYPDGREEILLNVPRYDFRWQNRYELAEPKRLPAGTTLRCVAHFDNSSANPDNPNPDVEVRTGPQSWDEMFNGYHDIVLADQDLTQPEPWTRQIQRFSRKVWGAFVHFAGLFCLIPAWILWRRIRRNARVTT